jgi:membrane protein YdbS with pleckstrin-like domain
MKNEVSSMQFSIAIIIVLTGCGIIVTLAILNVFFDYPDYFVLIAFLIIIIMFSLFAITIFFYENLYNYLKKWQKFNESIDSHGK